MSWKNIRGTYVNLDHFDEIRIEKRGVKRKARWYINAYRDGGSLRGLTLGDHDGYKDGRDAHASAHEILGIPEPEILRQIRESVAEAKAQPIDGLDQAIEEVGS